jgi:hypothetical protein
MLQEEGSGGGGGGGSSSSSSNCCCCYKYNNAGSLAMWRGNGCTQQFSLYHITVLHYRVYPHSCDSETGIRGLHNWGLFHSPQLEMNDYIHQFFFLSSNITIINYNGRNIDARTWTSVLQLFKTSFSKTYCSGNKHCDGVPWLKPVLNYKMSRFLCNFLLTYQETNVIKQLDSKSCNFNKMVYFSVIYSVKYKYIQNLLLTIHSWVNDSISNVSRDASVAKAVCTYLQQKMVC